MPADQPGSAARPTEYDDGRVAGWVLERIWNETHPNAWQWKNLTEGERGEFRSKYGAVIRAAISVGVDVHGT